MPLDLDRYRSALLDETEGVAALLDGADYGAAVPTCPEWTLGYLVYHIGGAHRLGIAVASGVLTSPPTSETDAPPPDRPADDDLADWLRAGAATLRAAVDADPEAPVWGWSGPAPAWYWLRRMTLETVVHRVDAARATGVAHRPAADLSADAVDEWLGLLCGPMARALPRMHPLRGTGERLTFATTDTGHTWTVVRSPDGVAPGDPGPADVTVTGPATDLNLVVARRADPAAVTVTGDPALFEHWLANTAF